jgi:L-threonylcarbamoyladenylate synthase
LILDGQKKESIDAAVKALKAGDVVAFATETVYGLGADIYQPEALEKIFATKARPKTDPLIVHIAGKEELTALVDSLPPEADKLIEKFWPGPLTVILEKSNKVSDLITAGHSTVAVRWPSHPVAQALIRELGSPIAAPSANKFQHISTTTAIAVEKELGKDILILDGGACERGLESTIVAFEPHPVVLRFGAISLEDLTEAIGTPPAVRTSLKKEHQSQEAPGQLELHYAPQTKLTLLKATDEVDSLSIAEKSFGFFLVFSNRERDALIKKGIQRVRVLSPKGSPSEAAKNLYSELRWLDEQKPKQIYALRVPDREEGKAINDRLTRAQH